MQITEQDIRRLAIGRLRIYYKFRPRRDWDGIRIVDRPHYYQHITIDARLTYIEPDGKPFVATVEATSVDRRAEVDFRFNWFRWLAESGCLALLFAGIIAGLTQIQYQIQAASSIAAAEPRFNLLYNDLVNGRWFVLFLIFLFIWALCGFAMNAIPRRYRYIFAVEQFKQFHANDQWVAISHEVFPSHQHRRFRELQRQCIRYGFGLMEVEPDRSVRILVAPKQGDYFAGKRRMQDWLPLPPAPPVLKKMLGPGEQRLALPAPQTDPLLQDPLDFTPEQIAAAEAEASAEVIPVEVAQPMGSALPGRPTLGASPIHYLRRQLAHFRWGIRNITRPKVVRGRPGYFRVGPRWLLIAGLGLILLAIALYRGVVDVPVVDVGAEAEAWPIERLERDYDKRVLPDEEYEAQLNDFYRENEGLREDAVSVPYSLEDELARALDEPDTDPEETSMAVEGTDVYFYRLAADTTILFSCMPLPGGNEPVYALEYGRAPDFDTALEQALSLHVSGGPVVTVTRGDCLAMGNPGYIIFVGDLITEESRLNFMYRQYTRELGLNLEIYLVRGR